MGVIPYSFIHLRGQGWNLLPPAQLRKSFGVANANPSERMRNVASAQLKKRIRILHFGLMF